MTDDTVWKSPEVAGKFIAKERAVIPFARDQIEIMVRISRYIDIPIKRMLDLGCGNGILGAAMLECYPEATCAFADFSPTMLDAARNSLNEFGDRATIHEIDYSDDTWPTQLDHVAFDVIVSGYSIHHQPDETKQRIYQQIYNLLSPGGIFIHTEHVASATPWVESIHDDYLVDTFYHGLRKDDPSQTREFVAEEYVHRDDKAANILTPVEAQCEWLRGMGFTDVDIYFKIFELAIFGGRKPA